MTIDKQSLATRRQGLRMVGKPIHQWHTSWPAHATTGSILRLSKEAKRLIDWKFAHNITSSIMPASLRNHLARELAPETTGTA